VQEVASVPLYLDWSFWAVIVAALAIILSQISPIHLLLKKSKLDLELYSRIYITHKVGNPNLQLHFILNNIGGRSIKIRGVKAEIKRDGEHITTLSSQNYLQNPTDTNSVLFTIFTLKPKDEWAHIVNFLNDFSRTDEKKYRNAESNLKANIWYKKKQLEDKDQLVTADDDLITPFMDFFDRMFIWTPGEYELYVRVDAEPERANIEKKYRFTLFESDSNDLTKYKDDYKYGAGIFFNSREHTGIIVNLIED
jgi:hypothetical protein